MSSITPQASSSSSSDVLSTMASLVATASYTELLRLCEEHELSYLTASPLAPVSLSTLEAALTMQLLVPFFLLTQRERLQLVHEHGHMNYATIAKFAWKRMRGEWRQSCPLVNTVWKNISLPLYSEDFAAFFDRMPTCTKQIKASNAACADLMLVTLQALQTAIQDYRLAVAEKAFSDVRLSEIARMVSSSEAEVKEKLIQKQWKATNENGSIWRPLRKPLSGESMRVQNLSQLTEEVLALTE